MATKIWGPLGWMTLHSISLIYPEKPSYADMEILKKFMSLFADTISCPDCKHHFGRMFNNYKSNNPSWFASRNEFFICVVRLHNTVNTRLDKPRMSTVSEALETIKRNTIVTSGFTYRNNYITYLIRNWSREQSGEGFILSGAARELQKINTEYWNPRDNVNISDLRIPETNNILIPVIDVQLRQNYFTGKQVEVSTKMPTHIRVSFISNKLKLGR